MSETGITGIILIIINMIVSYKGFSDRFFFENYKFEIDKVLVDKEFKRLVTSGFLHVNWRHLIFNMFSLYVFSAAVVDRLGVVSFMVIYFSSLIGGNLLATFVHRNHGDYSAVGASGAVCGVIFASIAIFPGMEIGFLVLPFVIPSWAYSVLFIAFSIYGIKSRKDNIGHEAHLGGALVGVILALLIHPEAWLQNYALITLIVIPIMLFIYFIVAKPHLLFIDNLYFKSKKTYADIDHKYNEERANKQQELDRILDKIGRKGIDSLTKKEKEQLEKLSK